MKTAGLGSVARSTDRRQQTRDLVLDTALRLFNEHGYLGVRVEDIAQQAGLDWEAVGAALQREGRLQLETY